MRTRKPCVFDRRRRLGWNVRLGMKDCAPLQKPSSIQDAWKMQQRAALSPQELRHIPLIERHPFDSLRSLRAGSEPAVLAGEGSMHFIPPLPERNAWIPRSARNDALQGGAASLPAGRRRYPLHHLCAIDKLTT